jgi:hypothetical protein
MGRAGRGAPEANRLHQPSITLYEAHTTRRIEAEISVPSPLLAYISHGQIHLQGDDSGEILESPFGRSLRDRAMQISNRNAWKTQGRGGQSLS